MTVYLDNNIFIDIEKGLYSIENLLKNVDKNLDRFFYSASHLQELNEIKAGTEEKLVERINKRFETISIVTNNNYLFHNRYKNEIVKLKEKPSIVYKTINEVPFAQNAMKQLINIVSEEQKELFRYQLNIDIKKINNYTPEEVINHINSKSDLLGGFSFLGLIEKAIEAHPQGDKMGLHNRVAGIFELLDMFGYWKDRFNEKSNYARLWDASHTFFSSFCDFFISNDRRTRNKAKVVFDIYNIKTSVVSSKGID